MKHSIALAFLASSLMPLSAFAIPLPKASKAIASHNLPSTFTDDYNFDGIVALSNCSGSIVRFETSKDTDYAMVLTNGHCYEGGFPDPGQVFVNEDSDRTFGVLDPQANHEGSVHATKALYSTMTGTDITLYRLQETYADILAKHHVHPLTIASTHPTVGTPIEVISGYWEKGYTCQVEAFIHELDEGGYKWNDSVRYSRPGCEVIGGTSGSPVVAQGTRTVIAINNTGNEDGEKCTINNPCEIDEKGNMTWHQGYSYSEETYVIYSCLNASNELDLAKDGCMLAH